MSRITEELIQYACQLEDDLMKIDFNLKYPENVSIAQEIIEKAESMRVLERSIPELEKHRISMFERFSTCIMGVFNRIQDKFNLQEKGIYSIKQKLNELEDIKREYSNFHPAHIYLQNQGYSDINILKDEIERIKNTEITETRVLEDKEREIDLEIKKLNQIIQRHSNLISSSGNSQRKSSQADDYLDSLEYSDIESVCEKISNTREIYRKISQQKQNRILELHSSLNHLEKLRKEHDRLSVNSQSSVEGIKFLQEKGFNSYESFNQNIQDLTRIVNQREKTKQSYHFTDRLDASTANNALIYIKECEKIRFHSIRDNAIDADDKLRNYIEKYGSFLKQEIITKFTYIRTICNEENRDPFFYSQDLDMCLQELLSFRRFSHVFECMNCDEIRRQLNQTFLEFYRNLSTEMEKYNIARRLRELRDHTIIAQALICIDRFSAASFNGDGFGSLYSRYHRELSKETKDAYRTVLDFISNKDFEGTAKALSEIEEEPLNPKDMAQIKHDLQTSLNKLMKDTKSIINWLDGKIERQDNRNDVTEIKENIDKIRIAYNKHKITELLDSTTQTNLKNFDSEVNEMLSEIILKGLKSIEAFMNADSFSEAEHGMKILSRIQRELTGYCTSSNVLTKSKELSESLDDIVKTILERSDFTDVNNYCINPPKDLLAKLKTTDKNPKFTQAYDSIVGKIRHTLNLAIEQTRQAPLNERTVKIRSLSYGLCFLPEDLQTQFKIQIDEMSKLIEKEETAYRQDLETSLTSVDEDEHAIAHIGILAEKYSKQNMHDLLKALPCGATIFNA
ncbi:unnamed protein product [Rotaria sp. Silwood1]|nr:unnamed protein product [Rotaria sp. Silwood1]CAF4941631.1 unnamed protein product [Rotaria sp. Silwood1]